MNCQEQIKGYIEQLDRKEYVMQVKEAKWNEIERILSVYVRSDYQLGEKLSSLKFLCDDISARRGINSVIKENEYVKNLLKQATKEIDNLVSVIQDLQNSQNDASFEDIMEEISDTSGGTGSFNFSPMPPKVPILDLNPVKKMTKDSTNYRQL